MAVFSGPLPPKKKGELQDLATELGIDTGGTREELLERIKKRLASSAKLAEDPRFSGLYSKRKPRSNMSKRDASEDPPTTRTTRQASRSYPQPTPNGSPTHSRKAADPESENDVIADSEGEQVAATQVALPPSPAKSVINEMLNRAVALAPPPGEVAQIVEKRGMDIYQEADKALGSLRVFLSNAKNITSLTILFELMFIVYTIVPWSYYTIPLPSSQDSQPQTPYVTRPDVVNGPTLRIPYPPGSYIMDSQLYKTLLWWSIPTLVVPQLIGTLVSFRPSHLQDPKEPDVLTSSIIRMACVVAGDWGLGNWHRVLGITWKWRMLNASISAAFALAEAIGERKKVPEAPDSHKGSSLAIEE